MARRSNLSPRPVPGLALRDDLAWGVRQAAFYAAAFCVLGVVGYVLGDGRLRAEVRAGALGGLAAYWGTAAVGGLLVGALRPRLGRLAVALAAGAAVGVLFVMACVVAGRGPGVLLDRGMWAAGGVAGVPLGLLCAAMAWRRRAGVRAPGEADAPVA